MYRTFNCGVGMVLIVDGEQCDEVIARLQGMGQQAWELGEVTRRDASAPPVVLDEGEA